MKLKNFIILGGMASALALSSCSDSYLDTEYTNALKPDAIGDAAAKNPDVMLNGIWVNMVDATATDVFGYSGVLLSLDMMGEDITMPSMNWFIYDYMLDYYQEQYTRTSSTWSLFYTMVSSANDILDTYPEGPSNATEAALVGQALAIRGFAYMNLIQIYQFVNKADGTVNADAPGVPLKYSAADGKTAEEIAKAKGRNTVGVVMEQIEKDLTRAVGYLGMGYKRPNKNFIDVNVANGLLARYCLLANKWQEAADAAALARKDSRLMGADANGLYDGFVTVNNEEWMWGFKHSTETQTQYASFFSHMSNIAPGYAGAVGVTKGIDRRLYESIPDNDYRKAWFNGPEGSDIYTGSAGRPYANVKFGYISDWTMNYVYMRAAEMVLIEAEAYAHMGDGPKAAAVLKELMQARQPGWDETEVTVEDVYHQRRIELWGEGFCFFDLKRLHKGINRMYEGSNHLAACRFDVEPGDERWTYQIPLTEIQENDLISEDDQN